MKPQLTLHIGMPKTGTTALQNTLRASAKTLTRHGILYPAGGALPKNHSLLLGGLKPEHALPRQFRQAYADGRGSIQKDLERLLDEIGRAIAREKPEHVVLSGEALFRPLGPHKAEKLLRYACAAVGPHPRARLRAQPGAALPLAAPAADQGVEPGSCPSRRPAYRRVLESYERVTSDIEVVAFDRKRLRGGDISLDFLHRVAPDLAIPQDGLELQASNKSISAEGMDLLHKYRKFNHDGIDGTFTKDTRALLDAIAAFDAETGFRRPELVEGVRRYLETSCVDLLWLRDRHGILFGDVDYAAISADAPTPPLPERIGDVLVLDEDRRDRMVATLLRRLAGGEETVPRTRFGIAFRGKARRRGTA